MGSDGCETSSCVWSKKIIKTGVCDLASNAIGDNSNTANMGTGFISRILYIKTNIVNYCNRKCLNVAVLLTLPPLKGQAD